jgi:hypothetical protein
LVLSSLPPVGLAISTPVNPSPHASPAKNEQHPIWSPTLGLTSDAEEEEVADIDADDELGVMPFED